MIYTTEHYTALMTRLSNEKGYLAATTKQSEIELRTVWIAQIEKEIQGEVEFLSSKGISVFQTLSSEVDSMSEDDLLTELLG